MHGELEQQLGEISGQLSRLFPALDRMEARQNEVEQNLARLDERVKSLQESRGVSQARSWDLWQLVVAAVLGAVGSVLLQFGASLLKR